MTWLAIKYGVTAAVVVVASEIARRSPRTGAVIAALPIVTVMTLIWLHIERQPDELLVQHARYTFWYVLPTLPMFLVFPWLLSRLGFVGALGASTLLTIACLLLVAPLARRAGAPLW